MSKEKKLQIHNSTAEFLIFTRQAGEGGIDVRVAEETVWLTQKLIGVLFDKGRSTVTEHLKNIFETGELDEKAACRDFRHTAEDGKDYITQFYNLDAIIAVGFRVNSARAIQFRQWATGVIRTSPVPHDFPKVVTSRLPKILGELRCISGHNAQKKPAENESQRHSHTAGAYRAGT